jgi:phosphoribosylanthranilate isomerase
MMIKICGITRREDAAAAVEAGASALGFIFYKGSPRYVTPEQAAELGADLAVWKVGVFVDEAAAAVKTAAQVAKLDVVQLYGGEAPGAIRTWRAFRITPDSGELTIDGSPEAVLLDGVSNGVSFDWTRAREFGKTLGPKMIVAGGLDASNVAEAIRIAQPWGVDASSRLEVAPGIKDHEKVRKFIQAARGAS